jgi:Phage integrase, N-terminal SAM-like domain
MAKPTVTADLQKRRATRYRGISYREKADGSRTYAVYFQGKYAPAGTTEGEARNKQSELLGRKARGEKVVVNDKTTFAELAEQWYEAKAPRLRKRTADYYRSALDLVLLPRFGKSRVAAIDADAVSRLVRDLEREGCTRSTRAGSPGRSAAARSRTT